MKTSAARDQHLHAIYEFADLIAASARSGRQRERMSKATGVPVTSAGLVALRMVERHGPIAMTELAKRLEVDLSTTSRQVKQLEDLGLVTRTTDSADRRVARLAITRKGRTLQERVRAVALNDFDVAMRTWTTDERATLARMLERLRRDFLEIQVDDEGWSVPG